MQSSAMVGPAVTLATTGNIYNAGLTYGTNKAVERETGLTASEMIINKIENNYSKDNVSEIDKSLYTLVDMNIKKTRMKILNQNQ